MPTPFSLSGTHPPVSWLLSNRAIAGCRQLLLALSLLLTGASWAASLTYSGNGQTSGTAPVDGGSPYVNGTTVTVLGPGTLVKTGNPFIGWNTAANGSGTAYVPGNTFALNADTTLYAQWASANDWTALGAGTELQIRALATIGSDLYVAGDFLTAGGVSASRIAKWNGTAWSALGSGLNARALTLAVSGTDLYVGGDFTTAGGVSANRIAKWNGTTWSALGGGTDQPVAGLLVNGTDLYAAGYFARAGGVTASRIAKWNGSTWSTLGAGLDQAGYALAMIGTDLYVGGDFTAAGGGAASRVAKWNGSAWSALGAGVNSGVTTLAVIGTDLYAGGFFTTAGGGAANYVAKWNGSAWSALGSGLNDGPWSLSSNGSDLYAGGLFTTAGGSSANHFAKWNGSAWSTIGTGMNGAINAVLAGNSGIYAGGNFTTAGSVSAANIARGNSGGVPDIAVAEASAVADGGSVAFGTATVGGSSVTRTFTITNPGTAYLTGLVVTKDGTNPGDFTVGPLSTTDIPVGSGTATFTVTYSPAAIGARSAAIHIASSVGGTKNPYDITVSGTGVAPEIAVEGNAVNITDGDATPSLTDHTDFGSTATVGGSVTRTFTVRNLGSAPLNLTGTPKVVVVGIHAADFTVTAQPASPIAASGTTTFQVTFDPSGSGLRSAILGIANDDGDETTFDFAIQGTGVAPEIAVEGNATGIADGDLSPTPADHTDFGGTAITGGTVIRTFSIRNLGTLLLNLTGTPKVVVGGAHAADFTVTALPTSPVAGGGTTTFQVSFDPSGPGLRSATLSIDNDDEDENPFDFAIQGTGLNNAPTDISLNGATIAENSPANTTVGTLSATDPDVTDTHTFTLVAGTGSTDNASFNISGNALRLTGNADFETQSSYSVRVQADDGYGGTFAKAFTITVSNVPDAPAGTDKFIGLATSTSAYTLTTADWGFSDSDVPANNFTAVQITTLPVNGLLKANGVNISAGQTIATVVGQAGTTWSAATGLANLDGLSSSLSQDGSKIVAGFFGGGLRVSSNGGLTWTSALPGTSPTRVTMSADGTKVYANLRGDKIFVSSDSGATWTGRDSARFWNALGCSADGTYAVAGDDFGIYVTNDGGVTWTPRITNAHWWAGAGVSADGSKMVATGDTEIRTSTDFGVTWTVRRTESGIFHTAAAMSADGTRLFIGQTTGKILVSTDSGATWTPRGSTAAWGALSCSADGMTVLANDGGNSYVSTDGGTTWVLRHSAPGGRGVSVSGNGRKMLVPSGNPTRAIPLYVSTGPAAPVITYTPPAGGLASTASFTFQVQDDGVSNNLDPSPNTITFAAPGSMTVEGNATGILNGDATPSVTDHTDFGSTPTVGGSITRTFTIRNNGGVALNLTGTPKVTVGGAHAADFTVVAQPTSPVAGSGGTTTFQVFFDPSAIGLRTATLSIANSDTAQNPFTFAIRGTGANTAPVTGNDSVTRPNNTRVVKVLKSVLLANDTDVDLDALSITAAANATPAGSSVTVSGNFVIYTAPATNSGNGGFDYTLSDGPGGHAVTGSVLVTEVATVPPNPPPNAANLALVPNGEGNDVVLTFLVAPGRQYRVQYAVGGAPYTWQEFSPQAIYTPASNGVVTHIDHNPVDPVRAYRLITHP